MLTADLVRASRRGKELRLRPLKLDERERALELAAAYLEIAKTQVGATRHDLVEAWNAVPVGTREKKLADGILKLVDDLAEFVTESPVEPALLRSELFLAASEARREAADGARFSREELLAHAGERLGVAPEVIERSLYADLKGEQRVTEPPQVTPEALLSAYESGQVQAVLLRAVRVVADVDCRSPAAYRALFRALKFRRLLHRVSARDEGGYRIEIDGPYSLFDSVTKYGLGLALVLPALEACDELDLVAEVRWGKQRVPLAFRHAGGRRPPPDEAPGLRDDVAMLLEAWPALESPWQPAEGREVLDLPGLGVCVPDLVFRHGPTGTTVHFEAMGYWSRDAVWKRVELAQKGLGERLLFAVSSRLRVSEAVLDDVEAASLYVYKGTMSARAIERKLDLLLQGRKGARKRAR